MSLQAEQSIIGCLLLEESNIAEVAQILSPEMFTDGFLGKAYYELKNGYENNLDIDTVVLQQKLADTIRSPQQVGIELAELVSGTYRIESIKTYADIVIRDYRARKASEIITRINITGETVNQDIRDITDSLSALLSDNRSDEMTVPEVAEKYKDDYFKDDERPRIQIGLKKIDEEIGLSGGDIMAIGARPKTGKSALAMQIAIYLDSIGVKVGYFNLEMTKKQMFERLVSAMGEIDLNRIRYATRYLNGEEEKYQRSIKKLCGMKNLTIYSGSKRVSDIRSDIHGKDYEVIIIDYLQLLKPDGKRGANRYAEVGDISRGMKAIAMDFNIPVIILSQLNRTSETMKDKEPSAADFRESGDIEQDVSIALLLWSPEKDNDTKRMLKIELNRQGKRCREELYFDGAHMSFYEVGNDGEVIKPKAQGVQIRNDDAKKKDDGFVEVEDYDIPFR